MNPCKNMGIEELTELTGYNRYKVTKKIAKGDNTQLYSDKSENPFYNGESSPTTSGLIGGRGEVNIIPEFIGIGTYVFVKK